MGSISMLLQNLQEGDEQALAALHRRCWPWIVQSARKRLSGMSLRAADEEDVAQEAFWGFVKSVQDGRVPQLASRHEFFALLTHIVARKAATEVERHMATKRGAGRVTNESALDPDADPKRTAGLQALADKGHTPAEKAALADCYRHYIAELPESLRPFVELYVAGATHSEIARQLDCVQRTVERKLALVRTRWRELAASELEN